MKTLVMDTAWKQLVLGLFEDGELVEGIAREAFKQQSETLFVELKQLLDRAGWKLKDIDEVIITEGPGSYTGLRIAMTVAKILGSQAKMKVRTLSTLQLYAGDEKEANVILDARGKRVYTAHLENGVPVFSGILPIEETEAFLDANPGTLFGEGELVGRTAESSDFLANFKVLLPLAKEVEDIDTLVPVYMKESSSYKV